MLRDLVETLIKPFGWLATASVAAAVVATPSVADACGCFAPPNPMVPVVQAGERIVFAYEDGDVVAHIQILYDGAAGAEFGWLLPLPSVPEFSLGTDELFTQIITQTQPRYRLNRVFPDQCGGFENVSLGGAGRNEQDDFATQAPDPSAGPLVEEGSVGPFDYAVLEADDKQEMIVWLNDNEYYIPPGTTDDDVVGPYIRTGAFFLALKLRSGEDAGNIQPVVVRYASDFPMIPIILTQVAANPDMGVQVWVLGEDRAIPRNYHHTVLNDEKIDWFNAGANYNDVIIAATNEAPSGQSFVTEYSGTTDIMKNRLAFPGRFGLQAEFEAIDDPAQYLDRMQVRSFGFTTPVLTLLESHIPVPEYWQQRGVDATFFYPSAEFYLRELQQTEPDTYQDYMDTIPFDAKDLTQELWDRVVVPTLEANALFDRHSKMTRMYTTLSPEEMTKDPVFSYNAELPEVSNEHQADFVTDCDGAGGLLNLPDGRSLRVENPGTFSSTRDTPSGVPFSRRIEILQEEGSPEVVLDNRRSITPSYDSGGCTAVDGPAAPLWSLLGLLGLAFLRRRSRVHS